MSNNIVFPRSIIISNNYGVIIDVGEAQGWVNYWDYGKTGD